MKIYVIYSNGKPNTPSDSVLFSIYSPNQNYSELWAQKEITKGDGNPDEFIGFFHFRRYLKLRKPCGTFLEAQSMAPYYFRKWPDYKNYQGNHIDQLLGHYDVIAPIPEFTGVSVRKRYGQYACQRSSDLNVIVRILKIKHPEYADVSEEFLDDAWEYYGNIYIMRRWALKEYFAWLIPLLEEFDSTTAQQVPRTLGYLAERLFGIWFKYQQVAGRMRCGWLPRVHFFGYDDKTHHFRRNMIINYALPAGTHRRLLCRNIIRVLRMKND